ncbi:MAG TPA: hypothetical protein VFB59_02195 [Candidatus Saccharimonadales bacterium]|nr:hypothetical protein [Candidatus Saccharimonadales bacterium]
MSVESFTSVSGVEQIPAVRLVQLLQGAGMAVPRSVAEIEAIAPFARQLQRLTPPANASEQQPLWAHRDRTTGATSVMTNEHRDFAATLGEPAFWELDAPANDAMLDILRAETPQEIPLALQSLLDEVTPAGLRTLQDYAQDRLLLDREIREHRAQEQAEMRAARVRLYGNSNDPGHRGAYDIYSIRVQASSTPLIPFGEYTPERVEEPVSRVRQFLYKLCGALFSRS